MGLNPNVIRSRLGALAKKAVRKWAPYRNKLESDYAAHLEGRLLGRDILGWRYEPMNLKLLDGVFYRVDFLLWCGEDSIELHEVKGWHKNLREAKLRFKLAKAQHPWFDFVFVTRDKGQWIYE